MNADSRPPVAIRITRPYASEDEYVEHELETLTRTGITLVGAQPRPDGVVLRFELVLPSGQVLLRGEGRVVGYKPNVQEGVGGLSLRFTRLDMRSKALVDRAAALREQRRPATQAGSERPSARASIVPGTYSTSLSPSPRSVRAEPIAGDSPGGPPVESASSSLLESSPSGPEIDDPPSGPSLEAAAARRASEMPVRTRTPPPPRASVAPGPIQTMVPASVAPMREGAAPGPPRESAAPPRDPAAPTPASIFASPLPETAAAPAFMPPPAPRESGTRERMAAPRAELGTQDRNALLARLRSRAKAIDIHALATVMDERRDKDPRD
ncbi:MAG TPA: hypothetical protein VK841_11415 [Polyangiaceae bacterium]|nr:hypothetical protein [Polyangiaceae bacterium]